MNRLIFYPSFPLEFYATVLPLLKEAVKLQTCGVFKKNEKGVLIFTDEADKKKYYGFNEGVEKVGDLVGKKVNLVAE